MATKGGQPFIDPRPALRREYAIALDQLRREMGTPSNLRERWRFWKARRNLWNELVERPSRSANW